MSEREHELSDDERAITGGDVGRLEDRERSRLGLTSDDRRHE